MYSYCKTKILNESDFAIVSETSCDYIPFNKYVMNLTINKYFDYYGYSIQSCNVEQIVATIGYQTSPTPTNRHPQYIEPSLEYNGTFKITVVSEMDEGLIRILLDNIKHYYERTYRSLLNVWVNPTIN